jgi:hypothetical protein
VLSQLGQEGLARKRGPYMSETGKLARLHPLAEKRMWPLLFNFAEQIRAALSWRIGKSRCAVSSVAISRHPRCGAFNLISEKFSQPAFETHFGRHPPSRFQSPFKVPNTSLVLDLSMFDHNSNRRQASPLRDSIVFMPGTWQS